MSLAAARRIPADELAPLKTLLPDSIRNSPATKMSGLPSEQREHSIERRNDGLAAHGIPVARKMDRLRVDGAALFSPGQHDRSNRLLARASVRSGDAADRHRDLRPAPGQRTRHH